MVHDGDPVDENTQSTIIKATGTVAAAVLSAFGWKHYRTARISSVDDRTHMLEGRVRALEHALSEIREDLAPLPDTITRVRSTEISVATMHREMRDGRQELREVMLAQRNEMRDGLQEIETTVRRVLEKMKTQ